MKPSTYANALDRVGAKPTRRIIKRMAHVAIRALRTGEDPVPVRIVRKFHRALQLQFNPKENL